MRHVCSGACFGQDHIVFASSVVVCWPDEIAVGKDEAMSLQNAGLLMALYFRYVIIFRGTTGFSMLTRHSNQR